MLVSFDVKALLPRICVNEALCYLEENLLMREGSPEWRKELRLYIKLPSLCMSEIDFTFKDRFFKITSGVAMGNPFLPLLSEIFIKKMEKRMEKEGIVPRFWVRYIDDAMVNGQEATSM